MNNNVQSHDQGQSRLNRTINVSSGPHRLRHDKIIKSLFNKNNHGVLTLLAPPKPWILSPTWADPPTAVQFNPPPPRRYQSMTFKKVKIVRLLTNA